MNVNHNPIYMFNRLIYFAIMSIMTLVIVFGILHFAMTNKSRSIDEIETTINGMISQCYALEGSYPADLQYLVEHYGLVLDESKYFYHYEIVASNIKPDIKVVAKWKEAKNE